MSLYNPEYALYLPAVNTLYAETMVAKLKHGRMLPDGITLDDFAFWHKKSSLWHYPHLLHSVGQYQVGQRPMNGITQRGRHDGVLLGDSGGYQIGRGTLKGLVGLVGQNGEMDPDKACLAWCQNYEAQAWIINWLETHANYAMTIDMPLWACTKDGKDSPFHRCTEEQLTQMTVENLKMIESHGQGKTRWLNVIQGLDVPAMKRWWDAVKWFDCAGYAFSSKNSRKNGLRQLLEPLLMMRDDGAFDAGQDRIHVLQVSTAPWAVAFTAVQRAMRATVNPEMVISYDSASPVQRGSMLDLYCTLPDFGAEPKSWWINKHRFPDLPSLVGSNESLPFNSPLADRLTLGDLLIKEGKYRYRLLDSLSSLYLMNHNIWVYLEAFRQANDLVFADQTGEFPPLFQRCIEIIEQAFEAENWATLLDRNASDLARFRG